MPPPLRNTLSGGTALFALFLVMASACAPPRVAPRASPREVAPTPVATNALPPMHPSYAAWGLALYEARCIACHSLEGSEGIGPTFLGLYGGERRTRRGPVVRADESYVRAAILRPGEHVVSGYGDVMPRYEGLLSEHEARALVALVMCLSTARPEGVSCEGVGRAAAAPVGRDERPEEAAREAPRDGPPPPPPGPVVPRGERDT